MSWGRRVAHGRQVERGALSEQRATDIERSAGIAVWRQIAERLRGDIASGAIGENGKLPTEAELATRFGVNRHTVRRAIAALAEQNVVRADRGRGTFITARPIDYPIGTRTRFSEIVSRQARQPRGRLIAAREERADVVVAEKLRLAVGHAVIRLETLSAADGVPLSRATSWFPADRFPDLVAVYAETGSITKALAHHGVADYMRRETRISARLADPDDAEKLASAPGAAVLVSESVNIDADGVPIQFSRSRFAADRVQIVVEK